jgi:hypothetical protein
MYKKMIEDAQAKGLGSEKIMWQSVGEIDDILCVMKKEHPEKYWSFVRKQHGLLYNNHYTEDFAMWDVEQMKPLGMYWTKQQIEEATKGMQFPSGTTLCDKFVAFNAFKNDLNGVLTDEQILKTAHAFWFDDKDWKGKNKIWEYMCLAHSM